MYTKLIEIVCLREFENYGEIFKLTMTIITGVIVI